MNLIRKQNQHKIMGKYNQINKIIKQKSLKTRFIKINMNFKIIQNKKI